MASLAVACPLVARSQATAPALIGVLRPSARTEPQFQGFVEGMRALGHFEGRNVNYDYVQAPFDRMEQAARELIAHKPAVIFAPTPQAALAARLASSSIPIVFSVVGDPVGSGLAASLQKPGGNATGLTALGSDLGGKRLELLREILPKATRLAVLWNATVPDKVFEYRNMEDPARQLKISLQSVPVKVPGDFDAALESIRRSRPHAMMALGDPLLFSQIQRTADFQSRERMPGISNWVQAVDAGSLISYGADIVDLSRRAAAYVDKILRGARPGDLPIEQPSKLELAINLQTARLLGIGIPKAVLIRADKVVG